MILTAYIVSVLLIATATIVIVSYGINNNIATASSMLTQQQSSMASEQRSSNNDNSVTMQSSDSSQSSSTSNSVITSESTSGGGTSSSSSSSTVMTGTGNNNFQIDNPSSGKIASSRLNLTTGEVEAVLFGDWSLNNTSGFVANFAYKPTNGSGSTEYRMDGLSVNSVNRINDNLVLAGTIDIVSNNRAVLQDAPVTIMLQNGILVVEFENATEAANLFGAVPILGFKQ